MILEFSLHIFEVFLPSGNLSLKLSETLLFLVG